MATTADIRKGLCIKYNSDIYKVIEFLHVKPGKGPAFVRTKLKSITTGKVIDNTFSSGHRIDEIRVEAHKYQFLYSQGDEYFFMNTENYEQITLPENLLDCKDFLKEGEGVTVLVNTETDSPISVEMPLHIVLEVTHTEPAIKGSTTSNVTKPATLETGVSVLVPLFINEGDKVKLDTDKKIYLERVSK